jgi:hypothetical protein
MSVEWFDRESLDRTIQDRIQKTDVVLDVGCGIRPQAFFVPKLHVLCEPYAEYLRILQNRYAQRSNVLILQSRWMPSASVSPESRYSYSPHLGSCLRITPAANGMVGD